MCCIVLSTKKSQVVCTPLEGVTHWVWKELIPPCPHLLHRSYFRAPSAHKTPLFPSFSREEITKGIFMTAKNKNKNKNTIISSPPPLFVLLSNFQTGFQQCSSQKSQLLTSKSYYNAISPSGPNIFLKLSAWVLSTFSPTRHDSNNLSSFFCFQGHCLFHAKSTL